MNPRFSIGEAVQVVRISDRRVIINRALVVSRRLGNDCQDVSSGKIRVGQLWGYELIPMPEMRQRYISERNLRPIPDAGESWDAIKSQVNDLLIVDSEATS